jgi:plasmid stabilization system protein ParE
VRKLVWTSAARADIDGIQDYFEQTDPRVGLLLMDRIEAAAGTLARHDTGRPGRIAGTREKSVAKTRHILVYEVHPDAIMVFRVVHTSQDWRP